MHLTKLAGLAVTLLLFASVFPVTGGAQAVTPLRGSVTPVETEPTLDQTEQALIEEATSAAQEASPSAEELEKLKQLQKGDVTQPEAITVKEEVFALFAQRSAEHFTSTNAMAFAIQYAVRAGVPANTVTLILMLPFLATLILFLRHVVGLPGFDMLMPIAPAITFVATGVPAGLILLAAIIAASFVARFLFKPIRLMELAKMALSILIVSIFVFAALTISAVGGALSVKQISIFPVLLLILLSEQIVRLQLQRSMRYTVYITLVTLAVGMVGYLILTFDYLRNLVLLYPEFVLILIPLNIIIGRYYGLRLTEYLRFKQLRGS